MLRYIFMGKEKLAIEIRNASGLSLRVRHP